MIDRALQDRIEELGLKNFCTIVASSFVERPSGTYLNPCSCGNLGPRLDQLESGYRGLRPHDLNCDITRFVLHFGSVQTISSLATAAHAYALAMVEIAAHPKGRIWDDVEEARALLGK